MTAMSAEKAQELYEAIQKQAARIDELDQTVARLNTRADMLEQCLEVVAGTMDQRVLAIIGSLSTAVAQHAMGRSSPAINAAGVSYEFRFVDGETCPANEQTFRLVRQPVTTRLYQQSAEGWIDLTEFRVPLELLANKFAMENELEVGKDYMVNLFRLTPKVPEQNAPAPETPQ